MFREYFSCFMNTFHKKIVVVVYERTMYLGLLESGRWSRYKGGRSMQCKYYHILLERWSFYRGGL